MADFLPSFVTELQTLIVSTWGSDGITADNIFSFEQIGGIKMADLLSGSLVNESSVAITGPMVVILYGQLTPDTDFGLGNKLFRSATEIWRFEKCSDRSTISNQKYVHGKLYALKEAIYAGGFSYFSEIEPCEIDSSGNNEANSAALDAQYKWIAGAIKYYPGLQVGDQVNG